MLKFLVFFSFFFFPLQQLTAIQINTQGETALLMNARTGHILFEKNGSLPIYPASTTKIATALFLIQKYSHLMNEIVSVSKEALVSISPQIKKQSLYRSPAYWLETDSSLIGLKAKEELPFIDLIYGMLISSGNDAANSLAYFAAGSIPVFMEQLNSFLYSLGCLNTHFSNPHGLHHPEHKTTAHDLAIITKNALSCPLFQEIVTTIKYKAQRTNLEPERIFNQTNKLLLKHSLYYYPKAIGVKTGFTKDAGKNLVAAAEWDSRQLIAVATGYRNNTGQLYENIVEMFEKAFSEKKLRQYFVPQKAVLSIKVPKAQKKLIVSLEEGIFLDFYPSEKIGSLTLNLSWKIPQLPFSAKSYIGSALLTNSEGSIIQETPLFSENSLELNSIYKLYDLGKTMINKKRSFYFVLVILWILGIRKIFKFLNKPKKSYYN